MPHHEEFGFSHIESAGHGVEAVLLYVKANGDIGKRIDKRTARLEDLELVK